MLYNKQHGAINLGTIVLIVVVGAGIVFGVIQLTKNEPQEQTQRSRENARDSQESDGRRISLQENTVTVSAEELIVGEQIVVIGTINQDGSLTADVIRIGISGEGFQNFLNRESAGNEIADNNDVNFEEFRNLSPDERRTRFEELQAAGGFSGVSPGGFIGRGAVQHDSGFARGEIIDKDEISITVKLTDGGSKLIFYSDETQILEFTEGNNDTE